MVALNGVVSNAHLPAPRRGSKRAEKHLRRAVLTEVANPWADAVRDVHGFACLERGARPMRDAGADQPGMLAKPWPSRAGALAAALRELERSLPRRPHRN